MTRAVELRRHTDNDGDVLTGQGISDALAIGERLSGVYTFAVSSGAQRATQTLACILAAGRLQLSCGVIVEEGLRSGVEDRWKAAAREAGSSHLDAIAAVDPELVASESAILGASLRRIIDQLAGDGRVLVVGHSPTNEAAVAGLTGERIDPLDKGAGVLVLEDGGFFRVQPLA